LLDTHCTACHDDDTTEAGINLSSPLNQVALLSRRSTWNSVLEQLRSRQMPPDDPRPTDAEYDTLTSWIDDSVNNVDWHALRQPGRTSLARKTTIEYANSVRDLFGVDLQAGVFLGRDPEGNTGFTNDRDSLSFPLFAFDDFLREAERAVDAYLGYSEPPWSNSIAMPEAWAATADKSTELNADGSAIVAKDNKAPFHFTVNVPFDGMYDFEIRAKVVEQQPISGLQILVDGRSVARTVISGRAFKGYRSTTNLSAGAHTLTLAYDPDRAPIVQPKVVPRIVPTRLTKKVASSKIVLLEIPDRLKSETRAVRAYRNLNAVIAGMTLTMRLAEHLIKVGETDYERTTIKPADGTPVQMKGIGEFRPSKVPFNLTAGKIAIYLGIPQQQFEKQMTRTIGFSFDDYKKTVNKYNKAFAAKHPERIRKKPGVVEIDRVTINSHAISDQIGQPFDITTGLSSLEFEQIANFAERAFGAPATTTELAALHQIYNATLAETNSPKAAVRDALVGLLVSPRFLLRFNAAPARRELDDVERINRLSHFLWLSIPDDRLRTLAHAQKITEATLKTEADRLVDDARFESTMRIFVEQWLNLSTLKTADGLDINTREAMAAEPAFLLRDIIRNDRSLLELIDSRSTYLNAVLANHYGLQPIEGMALRSVPLNTKRRGGLLSMGGMLTATSTPERTSPVTRGAWIVELLLGEELPTPPPSVPELKTEGTAKTVREQLELHRSVPECAGCHRKIDPYGFVLEHYDQFGVWRDKENGQAIDASTTLDDGTAVNGLRQFKAYLVEHRRDDFIRNLVVRTLEFALGREVRYYDEATVREISEQLAANDYRGRTLIHAVVTSEPFLNQTPTPLTAKGQ
jgi:hypothetical protein